MISDKTLQEELIQLSDELEKQTIQLRREIHQCPELSFHEYKTSRVVMRELERIGIPYEESPQKPGIIATIDSGKPGKFLMLRADMDALPIQESTGLDFESQTSGVMHACGHDVHTANLITVGEILFRTRERWNGKIKLVFQPAEENGGGGREMIKAGLMQEKPDACFALHVKNGVPGRIFLKQKYLSSYSDSYTLTIRGRAAHSSTPEEGVDAIYIASALIMALHGISSRNLSPMAQSTLNVGTIQGGSAPNIIADQAVLGVMLRNVSKESRQAMRLQIETLAKGISESMGGTCEIAFRAGYPAVYNDIDFTKFVEQIFRGNAECLYSNIKDGRPENWLITDLDPMLGAEDFGFFAQEAPSCMIFVGTGGDAPMHNPNFQVDEQYIKLCTRAMALTAAEYLSCDQ